MERRLAEIPTEEWADLSIDVTPRELVWSTLPGGFPIQLYERYTDEEGNLRSRPVSRRRPAGAIAAKPSSSATA